MKQKMKRLLAAMLVAVMFLSVGQGFSLNMKTVSAEEASSGSSDVTTTLFTADFTNTVATDSNSNLLSVTEGWTKHSGPKAANGLGSSNSVIKSSTVGDESVLQLASSNSNAASTWVQKDIDVTGLDNVTVEFQYYMDATVVSNNKDWYPHAQLKACDATTSTNNTAQYRTYNYGGYNAKDLNTWHEIKVEIIYDKATGNWIPESYEKVDGVWTESTLQVDASTGATLGDEAFALEDNIMHLCFFSYVRKSSQSCYIDDINIYTAEDVVVEEEVSAELFAADFTGTSVNSESSNLADEGWTKHSGPTKASGVGSTRSVVNSTKIENESVLQLTSSNSGADAKTWVQKDIDVTGLDNVTVEFQYYMDATVDATSGPWYPHAQLKCLDADTNTANTTAPTAYTYGGYNAKDLKTWHDIKVEITYDKTTGKWVPESYEKQDGVWIVSTLEDRGDEAFALDDNIMHLCFFSYVRSNKQSCFIDNISVYTIKNAEIFAADFTDTSVDDESSNLANEGWTKHSGPSAAEGLGSTRSVVKSAKIGNESVLQLTSSNSGADAKTWVQKDIDVTGLDNVTVEFQYYMDATVDATSGPWYPHAQLKCLDADTNTANTTAPTAYTYGGYNAKDLKTWHDIKVEITYDKTTGKWVPESYEKQDGVWIVSTLEDRGDEAFTLDDNIMHLCFFSYVRNSSQSCYIDNINVYTTNNKTYTAPTILKGASVRLVEGESGIRFAGKVDKAYVDALKENKEVSTVKFGVIITPETYLNDNHSDFTMRKLAKKYSENPYLKIEGKKVIKHDDTYEFRCAMIGIGEGLYGWEFAARSYIEIQYTDGSSACVYSAFAGETNVRSIKEVAKASLDYTGQKYTDVQIGILQDYSGYEPVYLSSNTGNDENAGTHEAPFATLGKAFASVQNYGEIIITDSCTVESDFVWPTSDKTITIKGVSGADANTLSFEEVDSTINIRSNVTIDNVKLSLAANNSSQSFIYANGYTVKFGEGIATNRENIFLYGGGASGTTVASTNLTVLGGNYKRIRGGSNAGTVTGDTHLYVGGTANAAADPSVHDHSYAIYGGGHNDTVGGNTYVTFTGSAKANYLYGGSSGTGNVGITNVTFSGGKVMCLHGGNNNSGTISGVNVTVTGGEMEQLFGANLESSMTGDVSIDLQGGKITRRVYGGCYNEYTGSNYVTGNINLIISSGVNITFDAMDPDTGSLYLDRTISASSRYATTTDEVCTITFVDEAAYTNYNGQCAGYDSIVKSYE